jgi:hypothetical protein
MPSADQPGARAFANRPVTSGRFATIKYGTPIKLSRLMVVDSTARIAVNWAIHLEPVRD